MWKEKLQGIIQEKAAYGEKINTGASEKEILSFAKNIADELNADLPNEYIRVIEVMNGIEFNGFILYGVDEDFLDEVPNQHVNGLLELNKIWYENEWQKQYIFLGESNISWYVYDSSIEKYYELDNPSGEVCEEFSSFESMLEKLLRDALM